MSKRNICQFFLQHGYCTLGNKCKRFHPHTKKQSQSNQNDTIDVTEICFSFDTTCSMRTIIDQVRQELKGIIKKLFSQISNIRIALIAHGDYNCSPYVIKYCNFTRDCQTLLNFINNEATTSRGRFDNGECYEYALWTAANKLKWTQNAKSKALVMIGDDQPHTPHFSHNEQNLDWKQEIINLNCLGITCFGIYCRFQNEQYQHFYQKLAQQTNGKYLELSNIQNITRYFVALCLKTSDDNELFEQYKNEILQTTKSNDELTKAMNILSNTKKQHLKQHLKVNSSIKRLMYDLKEIKHEKLQNISVVPASNNVFKWHVNVKTIQGMFKNVYIHLTLTFPSNYPSTPPQIDLITQLPNKLHPNIINNTVCLPLFGANNSKSKYGSSWSAAYSIVSLLVNIGSIFSEINYGNTLPQGSTVAQNILSSIRNTNCHQCGHCNDIPYPVLESNKIPFEVIECDANENYYQSLMTVAINNKNEKEQKRIISERRRNYKRGVVVAGNIIETVKKDTFWKIKAMQGINRKYHQTVSWQFTIDENQMGYDLIIGFVDENDRFFGVTIDGNVCFNNDCNYNKIYNKNSIEIKQHDIITYVLNLNNKNIQKRRDELFVFVNYNKIGSILLPKSYSKCKLLYPVMFVKNIRIHLTNDMDPKLHEIVQNNEFSFDKIDVFNTLQKIEINARDNTIINTGKYYTDQLSWNLLLEKALIPDILLDIFQYLSYQDLIHCKHINVFWNKILNEYNVIDNKEMKCFYTKQTINCNDNNNTILGVGLNVNYSQNNWIRSISTGMDLLSLSAYTDYNITSGAWGESITHWIPLIINEKHSCNAQTELLQRLTLITGNNTNNLNLQDALTAIQTIMNQFVLQLMSNTINQEEDEQKYNNQQQIDPKHASEKSLLGYCAFHQMLLFLAIKFPKMQEIATEKIEKFIKDESYRNKCNTPDLGLWLLNLTIVDEYNWKDVAPFYIQESLCRHPKWYVQKFPDLEYLDERKCSNEYRIKHTLKSTKISRRLVQFQVWFITNICKTNYSLKEMLNNYNKRWGKPTQKQKHLLFKQVHKLLNERDDMNSWLLYFKRMGINKYKTNMDVCDTLRQSLINSKNKGYFHHNDSKMNYKPLSNLMVRYLPINMTEKELFILFKPYGNLKRWKIVCDKNTGMSNGYGFVEYYNEWNADKAMNEVNGYRIANKTLKVSFAQKKQSGNNNYENTNIYIQNIPSQYDDKDLELLFIQFGKIINYTILRDKNGNSTNVGFVRFAQQYDAIKAIRAMNKRCINDKNKNSPPLYVKFAKEKTFYNQSPQSYSTQSNSTVISDAQINNYNGLNSNGYEYYNMNQQRSQYAAGGNVGTNIQSNMYPNIQPIPYYVLQTPYFPINNNSTWTGYY